MDNTIQFSVPTNREHFISWLDGQVEVINRYPLKYREGYLPLEVLIAHAEEEDENDFALVRIDGHYEYVGDDGRKLMERVENLLTFKVFEEQDDEGAKQVEVHGEYTAPPGRDYYRQILARIGKRWPSSGLTMSGTKRRSPGNRPGKANNWAYREIALKGRPFADVWREWKAKRGTEDMPDIDTREQLKDALKYRRKHPPRSHDE